MWIIPTSLYYFYRILLRLFVCPLQILLWATVRISFSAVRVLGSISHTLASTGYYSFFKVFNFDEQQLLYLIVFKINVMQDKFLVFCDFILLISSLDFVNVWYYICRISKINWTNSGSRLQLFMKNSQMLSLKLLDPKPFRSGIH